MFARFQFSAFRRTSNRSFRSTILALPAVAALLAGAPVARAQTNPQIPDEPNVDRPLLALDTGGHTAPVYKLMVSRYVDRLISISLDKTIRLWDFETGEPVAVLRPPVGPGAHGYLFSAALSPDGRLLAVGTYRALTPLYDHRIHLIDLSSQQIIRSLKGHVYTIYDLAFSPDGTQLASASHDNTIRIWNVETGETTRILEGHQEPVHAVAWSPDGKQIVSGSLDKTARIWSVETGSATAVLRQHRDQIMTVGWSPDGKTIATGCYDKILRYYEPSGKRRASWSIPNKIMSLKFSADSQRLLLTYGSNTTTPIGCMVLDVAKGTLLAQYKGHTNSPLCCTFLPDGELAATGDASSRIRIWNTRTAATERKLDGRGQSMKAVGWSPDGQAIGWGRSVGDGNIEVGGPLERTFCLKSLDFGPPPDRTFVRAKPQLGALRMGFRAVEPVDMRKVLFVQNGALLNTFTLPQRYDMVRCYTLLPGRRAVVGTQDGAYLVDIRTARSLYHMTERGEELWNLAPSPNWQYVLTGGNDQVLRVWRIDSGELLLALFVAGEEWIAWTPQGYYAASLAGESLMGWHLNRGAESLADYYPASRFHKSFYRPDVIRRLLETGNLEKAVQLADRERNEKSQILHVADVLPADVKIVQPSVAQVEQSAAQVTLKAEIRARNNQPLESARLIVNGRPYGEARPIASPTADATDAKQTDAKQSDAKQTDAKQSDVDSPPPAVEQTWKVELPPGVYRLAVRVESEHSAAVSPPVEVTRQADGAAPASKPKLYVLGIGASSEGHAVADVTRAIAAAGKNQFGEVIAKVLDADEATPAVIEAELAKIAAKATLADTTLVYYSGQETTDTAGHYRLAASRADFGGAGKWLSDHELKRRLAAIPGRLLLTIDTIRREHHADRESTAGFCGSTDSDSGAEELDTAANDFLRDLLTDEFGIVVLRTSRRPQQGAATSASNWFAQAFVEAVGGEADEDGDGVVQLHEVSRYVNERVRELSGGKQTPIIERPHAMRSFPLARPSSSQSAPR